MGYLARIPSSVDRRSVMLCVTPQGKKLLGNDPINYLVNAVAALHVNYQTNFGNTFRQVLDGLETTSYRFDASICRDCMFLVESAVKQRNGQGPNGIYVPLLSLFDLGKRDRSVVHKFRTSARASLICCASARVQVL